MKMAGIPPLSISSATGLPMSTVMEILSVKVVPSPPGKDRTSRPPNLAGISLSAK
jgi:hypothetical protein